MKKVVLLLFMLSVFGVSAQQSEGDRIIGLWVTGSGKGRIQITRYGEKYGGKLVWLREPNDANGKPKVDDKNPDETKRNKPKLGLNNLLGFTYKGKGEYEGGTIYDPENGKTYDCIMTLKDDNTLNVRGYVGISLFGRTDTWKRVKE
jgi:uncharacterized protein (DUF2147 family)